MANVSGTPRRGRGRGCVLGAAGCLGIVIVLCCAIGVGYHWTRDRLIDDAVFGLRRDIQRAAVADVETKRVQELNRKIRSLGELFRQRRLSFGEIRLLIQTFDRAFLDSELSQDEIRRLDRAVQEVIQRHESSSQPRDPAPPTSGSSSGGSEAEFVESQPGEPTSRFFRPTAGEWIFSSCETAVPASCVGTAARVPLRYAVEVPKSLVEGVERAVGLRCGR